MAGAGIQYFAKFCSQKPRIATTGITSWQTALKWTADYQALAQVARKTCGQVWPVAISLKFRLLTVSFLTTVILFMAIHGLNAMDCNNPRHTFEH
jgi:hypothetical protein